MHDNLKELAANPPNFIKNNITFYIYIYIYIKKKKGQLAQIQLKFKIVLIHGYKI